MAYLQPVVSDANPNGVLDRRLLPQLACGGAAHAALASMHDISQAATSAPDTVTRRQTMSGSRRAVAAHTKMRFIAHRSFLRAYRGTWLAPGLDRGLG